MALVRLRCACGTRILIRTTRALAAGWPVRSFRCHKCRHVALTSTEPISDEPSDETARLQAEPVSGPLAKGF